MTEGAAVAVTLAAPEREARHVHALTRRASLNAVASLLDYSAQLLTGLLVTPLLVHGLGPALFGAWEMLVRLGGYVSAADGRPTEALRLVVAQSQTKPESARRRLVGAAIAVWGIVLPILACLGALLVALAPSLVGASGEQVPAIRVAATCIVGSMVLGSLAAVPESVLRGLNLGHTRMGVQSALHLFGGALAAIAVWTGLGVAGLGAATLVRAIATGLCFWFLVARRVPWFGAERPARSEVKAMLGMSAWLTAGEFIARLILASDVVILGAIISPSVVATYVLTGYAVRVAVGVHVFTAGEAMPGIGALLGKGERTRARNARRELLTLTWLYTTVAGTLVLLWNQSFLERWVGGEHYAGTTVNLLLVLIAVQTAFIRLDSGILDASLRPRQRVLVGVGAAVVTLTAAILLTRAWGMVGLGIGLLLGRSVQSIGYPLLVHRALSVNTADAVSTPGGGRYTWMAMATTSALFAAALLLSSRLGSPTWTALVAGGVLSLLLVAAAAMSFGLAPADRQALRDRALLLGRSRGAR
jgi:O-antigen/teichoic acid export membrane protein